MKRFFFVCLFVKFISLFGWCCLVVACRIFDLHGNKWDLVSLPGVATWSLGSENISHWNSGSPERGGYLTLILQNWWGGSGGKGRGCSWKRRNRTIQCGIMPGVPGVGSPGLCL